MEPADAARRGHVECNTGASMASLATVVQARASRDAKNGIGEPNLTLPRLAATLRAMSLGAAAIAIGVGALVLIGWARDIGALKGIAPGLTAMNPASAVAFACLGVSLACRWGRV